MKDRDLISRQAAIDMLAAMQGRCRSKAALVQNSKIWQQIKDLPSAQEENSEDTRAAYEQGRIQGHVEMRTALLRQLKEIVGDEVWKNI